MEGELAQNAALLAVAIVTSLVGIFKYLKTEASEAKPSQTDTGQVMAASFLDARTVRELIETLRVGSEEYARETRKLNKSRQDLITALEEATEAILASTDANVNMVRFFKRHVANRDLTDEIDG